MGSLNSSNLVSAATSLRWLLLPTAMFLVSGCSTVEGLLWNERIANSEQTVRIIPVSLESAQPTFLAANNDSDVRKQNLFDIGESNYGGVFEEYEDVSSAVLIFPNDSLRLGGSNKAIIEQYVSKMDPSTDVLSVIGCSLGPSKINNGNSLLAIGRANRVKEAFLFSGLEHDQVLEEGCWSPESVQMNLPARGVVVTLKRQKKS